MGACLDPGEQPGVGEDVERLLVEDGEHGVEEVPKEQRRSKVAGPNQNKQRGGVSRIGRPMRGTFRKLRPRRHTSCEREAEQARTSSPPCPGSHRWRLPRPPRRRSHSPWPHPGCPAARRCRRPHATASHTVQQAQRRRTRRPPRGECLPLLGVQRSPQHCGDCAPQRPPPGTPPAVLPLPT